MDKYTDVVTVSKPVIYISIEEIISTHSVSGAAEGAYLWTHGSLSVTLNMLKSLQGLLP